MPNPALFEQEVNKLTIQLCRSEKARADFVKDPEKYLRGLGLEMTNARMKKVVKETAKFVNDFDSLLKDLADKVPELGSGYPTGWNNGPFIITPIDTHTHID